MGAWCRSHLRGIPDWHKVPQLSDNGGKCSAQASECEEVRLAIGDLVDTRLTAPLPVRIRLRK